MTIHKAQGMTIERVILNCKNMFQYGQLVVGLSRACRKKGLQVKNFTKNLLQKPPPFLEDFFNNLTPIPVYDNLNCCVNTSEFSNSDLPNVNTCSTNVNILYEPQELTSEDELNLIEALNDIETNLAQTNFDNEMPKDLLVTKLLEEIIFASAETEQQKSENDTIKFLQDNLQSTENFAQYFWDKLYPIKDKLVQAENISNKSLTEFYKQYNKLVTDEAYKMRVRHLFGQNPTSNQSNVIFKLTSMLRKRMLEIESEPIKKDAREKAERQRGQIFDESVGGYGKIRYIAGWCIYKLKKNRKKKILSIMYNRKEVKKMEELITEKNILEHLESSEMELEHSTEKESLEEINRRQNIRKGLTNVSDECSDFFKKLDKKIRLLQTEANLDLYGTNFSSFLKTELKNDKSLNSEWRNLFSKFNSKREDILTIQDNILEQVFEKYIRMSIGQLRKEYLQNKHTKKLEATRKQIKMRTDSKRPNPCNMSTLIADKSENKLASHKRLQSELIQDNSFLEKNFKKPELLLLCKAYNVQGYKSVSTKTCISNLLRPTLIGSDAILKSNFLCDSDTDSKCIVLDDKASDLPCTSIGPSDQVSERTENEIIEVPATCIEQSDEPVVKKTVKRKKRTSITGKGKGKRVKKTIKWPCGICKNDASTNSVGCDRCDTWFHGDCLKIENLDDLNDEWFCQNCQQEIENESD